MYMYKATCETIQTNIGTCTCTLFLAIGARLVVVDVSALGWSAVVHYIMYLVITWITCT